MKVEKMIRTKTLHFSGVNKRFLEREYENLQRSLNGENAELHSTNEQQAKRHYQRIKPIREYPPSMRKGLLNAKRLSTKIAEYWAKIPVKSRKSSEWVAKPHSQIESDAEVCESKLLKRNGNFYTSNYFSETVAIKEGLVGKIALVTGAASGIGREIVRRFALEGAKASVVDLNLGDAKKVAKEIKDLGGRAIAIECDVRDEEQVNRAVTDTEKNFGSVDILVNDAGILDMADISNITLEKWRNMFRVHVEGAFLFCRAVLKSMKEDGRIINISSIDGIAGGPFVTHYSAAKAAIIGLTRSLMAEIALAGRRITVNAIAPGIMETPMSKAVIQSYPDLLKSIPLQRWGKPEDIAAAASFLASSDASYITGQVIVVDGGFSQMLH
ncbi:MAG: SDR family NAD(P)-dependent oxidoreductase [Candidatus Freyarchaeum deiterrae]